MLHLKYIYFFSKEQALIHYLAKSVGAPTVLPLLGSWLMTEPQIKQTNKRKSIYVLKFRVFFFRRP